MSTMLGALANLAWRNLGRNVRRNFATGTAIAAGFTAFVLASGYANRVQNVLSRYTVYGLRTGHVAIHKVGALEKYALNPKAYSLTQEEQSELISTAQRLKGFVKSGRLLQAQGIIGNGCKTFPFVATGVDLDAEKYSANHPELAYWAPHISKNRVGQPITDFEPADVTMAVSSGLARLLAKTKVRADIPSTAKFSVLDCASPDIQSRFSEDANVQLASGTWDGQLNAIDGDMVQIYNTGLLETNNSSVLVNISHLQTLLNTQNATSVSVWLDSMMTSKNAVSELQKLLGDKSSKYDIRPWNDEQIGPYYSGTMKFIYTMVSFIGFVLAIVIVLSIFNSATMTIIERSEEVGMLRSLGYTRRVVRLVFALEGLYLTIISTAAGIALGLLAIAFVNSLGIRFNPPGVEGGMQLIIVPDFKTMILATICVSSLGLISTWLAVLGVSTKNISELVAGTHR